MQHILSKTHGANNTEQWMGLKEDNALVNAPMPKSCVPDPDTEDLFASNEVPPVEETEEFLLESTHDWFDVVGDPEANDDDGPLPF
jgi:hypothetical protein